MKIAKIMGNPLIRLASNIVYAIACCTTGILSHSWWFIAIGGYYIVLSMARYYLLHILRKEPSREQTATKTTGILLIVLSVCIAGINTLSVIKDRGTVFHKIIMITIAVYAFTKITVSIWGLAKLKKHSLPLMRSLRNIAFADALVSIYTMQRSMLVTFPGMAPSQIQFFNIFTGTAVWLVTLFLGINLIGGKRITMAKSKFVQANEKIAETVSNGYKKIENGVVNGYKKIETGVVNGYTKIEDKFVDTFLKKDGETIEEAKARLKREE